jgi:hypothetical protein
VATRILVTSSFQTTTKYSTRRIVTLTRSQCSSAETLPSLMTTLWPSHHCCWQPRSQGGTDTLFRGIVLGKEGDESVIINASTARADGDTMLREEIFREIRLGKDQKCYDLTQEFRVLLSKRPGITIRGLPQDECVHLKMEILRIDPRDWTRSSRHPPYCHRVFSYRVSTFLSPRCLSTFGLTKTVFFRVAAFKGSFQ